MNTKGSGSYGMPPYGAGQNPYFGYPAGQQQGGYPTGMPGDQMGAGAPGGNAMPGSMPSTAPGMYGQGMPGGMPGMPGTPGLPGGFEEESYIENILRLNKGKEATVYMTFENNSQWNAKVFKGIVEAAGRDHIILSDPKTGKRYLLLMIYLDYVTFDEELNYEYPFG